MSRWSSSACRANWDRTHHVKLGRGACARSRRGRAGARHGRVDAQSAAAGSRPGSMRRRRNGRGEFCRLGARCAHQQAGPRISSITASWPRTPPWRIPSEDHFHAALCGPWAQAARRRSRRAPASRAPPIGSLRMDAYALHLSKPALERAHQPGYLTRDQSSESRHGRPFPVQEHHVPEEQAGRPDVPSCSQAFARNHGVGQAGSCPIPPTIPACVRPSSPPRPRACPRT